MKKQLFFIPAIIFAAFYGLALIVLGFSSVLPIVYVWIGLFIISGFLLSKGFFWGGFLGMLPGINMMYMSTINTGQIIDIEFPVGIIVLVFYLSCCGIMFCQNRKDKNNRRPD